MPVQVITANRLRDGRVAYLTAGGGWAAALDQAWLLATPEDAAAGIAAGEAAVAAGVVVAPYAIEVEAGGGQMRPVRYRERIRAFGPSVAGASPA